HHMPILNGDVPHHAIRSKTIAPVMLHLIHIDGLYNPQRRDRTSIDEHAAILLDRHLALRQHDRTTLLVQQRAATAIDERAVRVQREAAAAHESLALLRCDDQKAIAA